MKKIKKPELRRTPLFKEIQQHCKNSIKLFYQEKHRQAYQENNKAIIKIEKLKKILEANAISFELQDFLKGNSSITRTKKK